MTADHILLPNSITSFYDIMFTFIVIPEYLHNKQKQIQYHTTRISLSRHSKTCLIYECSVYNQRMSSTKNVQKFNKIMQSHLISTAPDYHNENIT
jgi:hypothetical protein